MKYSDLNEAIARSVSHNEIAHLEVANNDEAQSALIQAGNAAVDSDLEFDSTDTNDGWDCWALKAGSQERMEWRVKITVAEEE